MKLRHFYERIAGITVKNIFTIFWQIFVQSNQGEEETTRISYFTFIGTPVQATNMNDFKRVSLLKWYLGEVKNTMLKNCHQEFYQYRTQVLCTD